MTKAKSTYLALLAVLLSPMVVHADPVLTGSWDGEWAGSGITAVFDMVIVQEADGTITGSFDWTCTSGITCSGLELFAGFFDVLTLELSFDTTGFVDPENIGAGTYIAWVSAGGNSMSGTDRDDLGTEWSATRVPEPGTLALLGLGLTGMSLMRRRRKA